VNKKSHLVVRRVAQTNRSALPTKEAYFDNYELGRAVEDETGIDLEDIPIARDLKYCVFYSWWKITETGVEGPYDEKRGEKK